MIGVDFGSRRIGLACSDPTGTIATPLRVLDRAVDHRAADHRAIVDVARENEADRIIVGLPLSLSGDEGPAARAVLSEVEELRNVAGTALPVDVHDERFTTVTAERTLVQAHACAERPDGGVRDAVAAAVMLQSYLEAPR